MALQYKIYFAILFLLIAFISGGVLVYRYESAKLEVVQNNMAICTDSNKSNIASINELLKNRLDMKSNDAARLKIASNTITKVQITSQLESKEVSHETTNSTDDILNALNIMYSY